MEKTDSDPRWPVWRSIFADAWRSALKDLQFITGWGLMVPALLFAIYVVLVWQFVGVDQAGGEVREKLLAIAAPLLALPICYLVRLALVIPDRENRSAKRIALLHTYLQPRLTVELLNEGQALALPYGTKTKSHGGDVVTNISGHDYLICAVVKNTSGKEAKFVAAQFSEVVGDNGSRMRDPVSIYWGPKGYKEECAVVPANGERTLLLFRVGLDGVYFSDPDAPLEYQMFFNGGKTFTGRFVLEELYHCSLEVHFVLELSDKPTLRIVHTNGVTHRTVEEREQELAMMERHHV